MAKKKSGKSGLDINALIANENIIKSDVCNEIEDAMLTYAIKTIIDRAIPDIRDGFKPVHRRVLYGAWLDGITPNKKYVKNAKTVGTVMGEFHPHGDGSIYDSLVTMSQQWTYRYPLIDFQGNNGSPDGDAAGAMRYTEGRLDKLALYVLGDIDKECVNFKSNYSETTVEPEVLPGLFPNFLCNGGSGIATGYTTNIPSHQLGEVIDGIIATIKKPDIEIDELMQYVKGPDFPEGAYLIKNEKIKELYQKGKGSLTFKAKYELEENAETENNQIVITELPPDINKPKLVAKIHALCIEKKEIPRVVDVRDESVTSCRIVIELHKTAVPDIVIKELYKRTELEKSNSYIMRAIVNQTPKILNLKEVIEYYIEHRRDVVTRRTKYVLNKASAKLHIQEGLKLITDNIDKAIKIIKESENDKEAKEGLKVAFKLSDIQANEVLEIKLRQLTKLNKNDIEKLIADLNAEIVKYNNILSGQVEIDKVIISELKDLKNNFNDERKTLLIDETESQQLQSVSTNNEPIVVLLTSKNTVKHITLKALDDMFKNGTLKERNEIFIEGVKCTIDNQFLLIFGSGEYAKCEFNDLIGLSFLDSKVDIKAIVTFDEKAENKAVVVMTKKGIIKKTTMDGFRARMRRVAPLLELVDDEIIGVRVIELSDDNIITLATKDGLVHRFFEKSFKETSAGGKGINGITLMDDNEVIDFNITNQNDDDNNKVVLFTKHDDGTFGMKSMPLTEFKPKGRIAQGIKGIEFGKKNMGIVTGMVICKDDFFTLSSKGNVTIHKFVSLPDHNRYNKAEIITDDVVVRKFFLEE